MFYPQNKPDSQIRLSAEKVGNCSPVFGVLIVAFDFRIVGPPLKSVALSSPFKMAGRSSFVGVTGDPLTQVNENRPFEDSLLVLELCLEELCSDDQNEDSFRGGGTAPPPTHGLRDSGYHDASITRRDDGDQHERRYGAKRLAGHRGESSFDGTPCRSVSYTHLTLPTKRIV